MNKIICPHCNNELTTKEFLKLYSIFCSNNLKGRTSELKKISSKENGKKGGRPKKNIDIGIKAKLFFI